MVQLTNSTPGNLGSLNRDTDSPKLWIGVISSSLLLHLLLGLGLLWSTMLQGQLKSSEKRTENIPIEFITLPAETASLNQEDVLESSPAAPSEEQSVSSEPSSTKVQPQPTVSSITVATQKPEKSVVTSPSPKISVPQPQSSPIPQKKEKTPSPSNSPQLKNDQSTETQSIPQETTPSSSPLAEKTEKRSSPKISPLIPSPKKIEANSSPTTSSPIPIAEKVEENTSPTTSPPTPSSEETETPDSQPIAQQNFPIPTNPENYPSVPPEVTESSEVNPSDSPLIPESAPVQTETPPSKEIPDSAPSSSSFQGLMASLGTPRLTHPDRDIPDRLAKATQTSQEFSVSYLSPLEEEFDGNSLIEVVIIIEKNGKSIIAPGSITVLEGNLKQDKAEKLAKEIIEQWQFEPTYMGGKAVDQEYLIQFKTSPL